MSDAQEKHDHFINSCGVTTGDIMRRVEMFGRKSSRMPLPKEPWHPRGKRRSIKITTRPKYQGNGIWALKG